MNISEKKRIREKISNEKPEHLGGFDQNWLFIREHYCRFGKIIQVFSVDGLKLEIVTTMVC